MAILIVVYFLGILSMFCVQAGASKGETTMMMMTMTMTMMSIVFDDAQFLLGF